MFICVLNDESIVAIEDVYCDIGNMKTGFFLDENGKKVIKSGIVIDILQSYYDDWN